ncbi:response regulator [Luteibacter sp. PPL201]|uniref:Response regulator n=1 Tax=Luteibacter sahnii TaxID=3021977 RepID=A0ABT6B878_9GAMM|nr:response regulator [Luteibacter sp. PPL193]MDY1547857.1 response regulator [Luteibacter sp. PPL193]
MHLIESPTTCLLVEDDHFVSDVFELILEDAGFRVCHVAVSEPEAIDALLKRRPDIALVDIDIQGGDSMGVATALLAKDIPVAFVSGHPRTVLPPPFSSLPYMQKPVTRDALVGLAKALSRSQP